MADNLKFLVIEQVHDVLLPPGEKIVEANNFMTFGQEPFAPMRADEPGTAGN